MHQLLCHAAGLSGGGPVREKTLEPGGAVGVHAKDRVWEVVNVDPRESELERCSRSEFAERFGLILQDDRPAAPSSSESEESGRDLRRGELFRWVLLALVCVLLAENLLGNRTVA
jgi:hypothetical protein